MIAFLGRHETVGPQASHVAATGLLDRMRPGYEGADKIGDLRPLYDAAIGDKIDTADFNFLRGELASQRTPDGEALSKRQAEFMDEMAPVIEGPNLDPLDPARQLRAYEFAQALNDEIARYRNEAKNPFDLFRRLPNESDQEWAARASGGRVSVEPPTPQDLAQRAAAASGSPGLTGNASPDSAGDSTADAGTQAATDGELSQLQPPPDTIHAGLESLPRIFAAFKEAWDLASRNPSLRKRIEEFVRSLGHLPGLGSPEPAAPTGTGEQSPAELPTPERDQTGTPRPTVASGASRYVERNGQRYVALANGSDVLGEITPEIAQAIGREAAPIRFPESSEAHIEAVHGEEIRSAGYGDIGDFVAEVTSGFNRIYAARRGALYVVKPNGLSKIAIVELRPSGSSPGGNWEVVTAALYRPSFFRQRQPLWTKPGAPELPLNGDL